MEDMALVWDIGEALDIKSQIMWMIESRFRVENAK